MQFAKRRKKKTAQKIQETSIDGVVAKNLSQEQDEMHMEANENDKKRKKERKKEEEEEERKDKKARVREVTYDDESTEDEEDNDDNFAGVESVALSSGMHNDLSGQTGINSSPLSNGNVGALSALSGHSPEGMT